MAYIATLNVNVTPNKHDDSQDDTDPAKENRITVKNQDNKKDYTNTGSQTGGVEKPVRF